MPVKKKPRIGVQKLSYKDAEVPTNYEPYSDMEFYYFIKTGIPEL